VNTPSWRREPSTIVRLIITASLSLLVALGCAPSQPTPASGRDAAESGRSDQAARPKGTLKIAYAREPETLSPKFLGGGGGGEYAWIFSSTLTFYDVQGAPHPLIARELPAQERGDWVMNPDGTMITTYRLRENARWHDGTPLTADDFVFAHTAYMDPELPPVSRTPEELMTRVEARDPHTLVIHWKETYPLANLLGHQALNPLPRHLLEDKYRTNRASFSIGEEWTTGYVGSGPFRVERWTPGSGIIARAVPDWFLGPPRIETVEIRFINNRPTIVANLLSGEIDLSTSPAIRTEEAVQIREQWGARGDGYIKTWETRMSFMDFQHREVPGWQRAVTDLRVRRGLMHAVDRDAMADVFTNGLGTAADAFITRGDPLFAEVDRAITKYPYDPSRATAAFAEAGWSRAQAGGLLSNADGQPLEVSIWSNEENEAAIIADNWKAAGLSSSFYRVPAAQQRDHEHRNSFPGANTGSKSTGMRNFDFLADAVPKAENGWLGSNRGSFIDADVERLYRTITTSLRQDERATAEVALHKRMSETMGFGPLFYSVEVILAKNRVKGPVGNYAPQQGATWNIYEWEVTD
jgi:peptide/nickel transport system substrate-binding protein